MGGRIEWDDFKLDPLSGYEMFRLFTPGHIGTLEQAIRATRTQVAYDLLNPSAPPATHTPTTQTPSSHTIIEGGNQIRKD